MTQTARAARPIIVFDLDGTLVDHTARMYCLYRQYLGSQGLAPIALDDYKALKLAGTSERDIAARALPEPQLSRYLKWKIDHIEDRESLRLDVLMPDAVETLRRLHGRCRLILLTARQRRMRSIRQLHDLDIRRYFDVVITCPGHNDVESKHGAIAAYLGRRYPGHLADPRRRLLWVGDTEREIEVARRLNAPVFCVATGVRSEAYLRSRRPDLTLRRLSEIPDDPWAGLDTREPPAD